MFYRISTSIKELENFRTMLADFRWQKHRSPASLWGTWDPSMSSDNKHASWVIVSTAGALLSPNNHPFCEEFVILWWSCRGRRSDLFSWFNFIGKNIGHCGKGNPIYVVSERKSVCTDVCAYVHACVCVCLCARTWDWCVCVCVCVCVCRRMWWSLAHRQWRVKDP